MNEQSSEKLEKTNEANAQTIDQVKELLFGNEQRGLEARIIELENELAKTKQNFLSEIQRLEDEASKRADAQKQDSNRVLGAIGGLFESVGNDIGKLVK
ncbi:MAG: hypothetical protein AAF217_01735 [Pseudomonadota bacterium]